MAATAAMSKTSRTGTRKKSTTCAPTSAHSAAASNGWNGRSMRRRKRVGYPMIPCIFNGCRQVKSMVRNDTKSGYRGGAPGKYHADPLQLHHRQGLAHYAGWQGDAYHLDEPDGLAARQCF